jgi:thioredoxin 1
LSPTIEALCEEYADSVKFGSLDVETNWQTAGEYGIKQVPAVLLFHYGDVVARLDGIQPRSNYRKALDAWQPMDWVI